MTKREDYIQEVREGIAHRVNRFLGNHIRKACEVGMEKPDGSGFIDAVLADPRIAIIDPEQAVSLTTINNAPVGLDEVSQVIAQGYRKVIPKEEYVKEV